jgi:hypothetical protein
VVLRPVGPLPPGAYWLRRLFVLGIIVLIVVLVWWLFNRGGGGDEATVAANPTTSPSSTPTDTASAEPTKTKTKSPSAKKQRCADQDIEVSVVTDAASYPADAFPNFTLAVENVSGSACSRDVGSQALELRVSSGGSRVWSSDDCNPSEQSRVKDLKPGDRFVQTVQWDRVESAPGCPTPQQQAPAGDYQVLARDLEKLSDPVPFVLK